MDNIIKISFDNYKCFKSKVTLDNIKPINIIIGKNNIGKSSILDVIEMMYNPKMNWENYNSNIYAEKTVSKPIIERIFPKNTSGGIIGGNYYEFGEKFIGKRFTFKIEGEKASADKFSLRTTMPDNIEELYDIYDSKYNEYWSRIAHCIEFNKLIKTKRIYAERNIVPEEDKNNFYMDGYGNGATNSINSYLNKSKYDENIVKERLLEKLNEILGEDANYDEITTQQIEIEGTSKWEIFLREKGKTRVALSKSGSGLKTILLVLIYSILIPEIERQKIDNYVFLFEELENNLHPSLERRLLKYIEEIANKGATIFLTTHSSTVLDSFQNKENVQLYHVLKENEEVVIKNLRDYYGKSGCIDDLGIKASDILQSNGIIWVEGPSDRIYINKWISLWSDGTIREGMDYQCVFYGGKLLSNISFDDNDITDLVKLININRNSIVVIDSDKTAEGKRINKTKARIKEEVELNNNLCWITKGKEIENYIPKEILEKKYSQKFKREFGKYDKINEYLNDVIGNKEGDKFFRSKIEFAQNISTLMEKENMKESLDLDSNMKKVIERIKSWNKK